MAKAKKTQKNEKFPKLVKILGGVFLAMIALVIFTSLFKEPTQEPKTGAHSSLTDSSSSPTSSNTDVNHRYLLDVIRNHPREEVSKGIWPKINEGNIQLSWLHDPAASGHFLPMPVVDTDRRLVGLRGTLSMPLDLVERARRGNIASQAYLLLVLLHETVHYEQITTGRFSPDVITKPATKPEDCVLGWQLEREAYYRECEYAMSTGVDSVIQVYCMTLEPEEFDRNLFPLLSETRTDNCPAAWAEALQRAL